MSLFYEDFEVGRRFVSGSVPVTEAHVRGFAELTGDHNPVHFDPTAAHAAGFSEPVAHGVLGLALATGLASGMKLTHGTLVALVAITWRFIEPVYPGDDLSLHLQVTSRRLTSRPGRGLVTLAAELRSQSDRVVQEGEFVEIVKLRS